MKKILSIILSVAVILTISGLTACQKDGAEENDVSVETSLETTSSETATSRKSKQSGATSVKVDVGVSASVDDNTPPTSDEEKITVTQGDTTKSDNPQYMRYVSYVNSVNDIEPEDYSTYTAYLEEVEAVILQTEEIYTQLTPEDKTLAAECKASCDQAKKRLESVKLSAKVSDLKKKYAELPEVAVLSAEHVPLVAQVKSMFDSLGSDGLALLDNPSAMQEKINACYDNLKSKGLMEYSVNVNNISAIGESTVFIFSEGAEIIEATNDKLLLNGTPLIKCIQLTESVNVTFNANFAGTLKIYAYCTGKISLTDPVGSALAENKDTTPGDDYCIFTFNIEKAGSHTLSMTENDFFVYAIVLSAV